MVPMMGRCPRWEGARGAHDVVMLMTGQFLMVPVTGGWGMVWHDPCGAHGGEMPAVPVPWMLMAGEDGGGSCCSTKFGIWGLRGVGWGGISSPATQSGGA